MATFDLPPASADQKYVEVSPIPGGFITLSDHFFVAPADPNAKRTVPSLTFLIKHPGTSAHGADSSKPFYMMFDLGLRKAKERYPEVLQKHLDGRAPFDLAPGVAAQLKEGGLDPNQINLVMLSHVHYDHHGDPEMSISRPAHRSRNSMSTSLLRSLLTLSQVLDRFYFYIYIHSGEASNEASNEAFR